jgi:hypothetical protein
MNRIATSIAIASAALATQVSSAAAFLGNFTGSLVVRNVTSITQTTVVGQFPMLPVRVTMCSGAIEMPVFAVTGASTAQANGSTYAIRATIAASNRTIFEIWHTGANNNGIKSVTLGNGGQRIIFDRIQPSPGTAGSLTGRDVIYLGGVGVWNMRAVWSNPIRIPPAAPAGDVHNTLIIDFDACFDWGDSVRFEVDTDMVG